MRVSYGYALAHLSEAARKVAIWQGNYFFFEEDCDWAVAALELPHLWSEFFKWGALKDATQEEHRHSLETTVKRWNPEYFKSYEAQRQ